MVGCSKRNLHGSRAEAITAMDISPAAQENFWKLEVSLLGCMKGGRES